MNNNLKIIIRWITLLFLQVVVFNNINFGGYINPQIYVLFVIVYPFFDKNRSVLMILSFSLGIAIDFFMNSGGINAFSLTLIAYLRLPISKLIIGQIDKGKFSIRNYPALKGFNLVFTLSIIHHTSLFWLENYSMNGLAVMFSRIFFSAIATSLISIIFISIFLKKQ
jgi:rod shape-determining protein MreD